MTLAHVQRRLDRLEQTVEKILTDLEYRRGVAAIREGLDSADRNEGDPASKVFARLRRKHKIDKPK